MAGVKTVIGAVMVAATLSSAFGAKTSVPEAGLQADCIDLSGKTANQCVIASGTKTVYEGHPTTVATKDGRVIAVWCSPHGGACGHAAETKDGGRTWERIDGRFPAAYRRHVNCPSAYRLDGPDGKSRLFVFSQLKLPEGVDTADHGIRFKYLKDAMPAVVSEDEGLTWRELPPLGEKFSCVMAFASVVRLKDGAYLGMFHSGAGGRDKPPLVVKQAITRDGGFTWSDPRVVCEFTGKNPCEPCVFRSPDGKELCCLMRENTHTGRSLMMFSRDEGVSWTKAVDTSEGLTGDRHEIVQLADGRLCCAFRDMAPDSPWRGSFVAWTGSYDSLRRGCDDGAVRFKLLHQYPGGGTLTPRDCGYCGLTALPGGDVLAVTYVHYRDDDNMNSVVAVRIPVQCTAGAIMPEYPWLAPVLAVLPLVGCIGLLFCIVLCEKYAWFAQFVKYGTNGVIATYVQTGTFYLLAATCLACLGPDDVAVKYLGLSAVEISDGLRALRFAVATAVGFVLANIVCWLMNRWCVFKPGKFRWYVELAMFFGASTVATVIALGLSSALIHFAGLMTTLAVFIEIVVSFFVNFFVRKFFIFKG